MRPLGGGGSMAIGPITVLITVLATTGRLGVGVQKTRRPGKQKKKGNKTEKQQQLPACR